MEIAPRGLAVGDGTADFQLLLGFVYMAFWLCFGFDFWLFGFALFKFQIDFKFIDSSRLFWCFW